MDCLFITYRRLKMTKESALKVHHATAALAAKSGITFKPVKDGVQALHESGKKAKAPSAKEALAKVLTLVKSGDVESKDSDKLVVVKDEYKKRYAANGGNNGDALAETLTVFRTRSSNSAKAFATVCRENKIEPSRWDGHNSGLQWMALRNVLRTRVRKGEEVVIDGVKITNL